MHAAVKYQYTHRTSTTTSHTATLPTRTPTHKHPRTSTRAHAHTRTRARARTCESIDARAHTHTHTHTHTCESTDTPQTVSWPASHMCVQVWYGIMHRRTPDRFLASHPRATGQSLSCFVLFGSHAQDFPMVAAAQPVRFFHLPQGWLDWLVVLAGGTGWWYCWWYWLVVLAGGGGWWWWAPRLRTPLSAYI